MNVVAVQELVKICKNMKKLAVSLYRAYWNAEICVLKLQYVLISYLHVVGLQNKQVTPQVHVHNAHTQSLVHISTAYCHCNRKSRIDEILYPPKIHPDKLLGLLE